MATFLIDMTQKLGTVDCHMTFHYNNISMGAGISTAPADLATNFVATFLPLINALQCDTMLNDSIYVRDLGSPSTAYSASVPGAGAITATTATTLQPAYVGNISRRATTWTDVISATTYIGTRPGNAGRIFLSGLGEDWQNSTGAAVPAGLSSAYTAFLTKWLGTLTLATSGTVLNHVIWSAGKAASGALPARNPLVGDVTSGGLVSLTRLVTRKT